MRLTGGVIIVLLTIGVPFLLAFHSLLRKQQLDTLAQTTFSLSALVVDGLRSSMTAGQPHLFDQTIRNLAGKSEVERVVLLNHKGRVRVSSDRKFEGRVLDRGTESTCIVCHREGRAPASNWAIAEPFLRSGLVRADWPDDRRVAQIDHADQTAVATYPREPLVHSDRERHQAAIGALVVVEHLLADRPVCACLRDDVYRAFRCGFPFPDLFVDLEAPLPGTLGQPMEVRWAIHPWGPVDGPYRLEATLRVDGKEVPVPGKGLEGRLTRGKDGSATLRFPAPSQPFSLRITLRHLPPGAQTPVVSVTEMLVGVTPPGNQP